MNFTGKRAVKSVTTNYKSISVADYMTKKLISFHKDDSLQYALETLVRNEITGAPVLDDDGSLIGMISETDFVKCLSDSRYFNMPWGNEKLTKYMSTTIETISASANIFDAMDQFNKSTKKRFPVLQGGKLVGQISQHDVLLAALKIR